MRHATAMYKMYQAGPDVEQTNMLLTFSDGGTDQRNNLESVKIAKLRRLKKGVRKILHYIVIVGSIQSTLQCTYYEVQLSIVHLIIKKRISV